MYAFFNQNKPNNYIVAENTGIRIRAHHPHGNSYINFLVEYDGEYLRCDIVGTKYQNRLEYCVGEFEGMLVPEPDNKFSRQAVKIMHENGIQLGYVPESYDGDCIRRNIDLPCQCHGILMKGDRGYYGIVAVPKPKVDFRDILDNAISHAVEVQDFTVHTMMRKFRMSQTEATDMLNKMVVMNVCRKTRHGYYIANGRTEEEMASIMSNAETFDIAGINFRGLNDQFLGLFDGMLYAEKDNEHDPYAVAIFKGSKHVGYIPRGNKAVWQRAIDNGGVLHCTGYINKGRNDGRTYYYGEITINK